MVVKKNIAQRIFEAVKDPKHPSKAAFAWNANAEKMMNAQLDELRW
jgi:hypothetical protein